MGWVCPAGQSECVCARTVHLSRQAFKGLCNCFRINSAFHSCSFALYGDNCTLAHKQHACITFKAVQSCWLNGSRTLSLEDWNCFVVQEDSRRTQSWRKGADKKMQLCPTLSWPMGQMYKTIKMVQKEKKHCCYTMFLITLKESWAV